MAFDRDVSAGKGMIRSDKKSFKYVEPIRKIVKRANLKGVECVSQHQYRFAPPSAPKGFWNTGLESEI
nr:protein gamma response 1 [Tanacetum cinerariifolium]